MKTRRPGSFGRLALAAVGCAACACSGSPTRYRPPPPGVPAGLTASAGSGQVTLRWEPAADAAEYRVYYSALLPGVTKTTGTKYPSSVVNTSLIVPGLANGIPHYFVITAFNSSGESAESSEVSATPVAAGSFVQAELQGTWRFTVLSAGARPGWMRGSMTVDAAGTVTYGDFLDSAGDTSAPAGLIPSLLVSEDGHVRDASDPAAATFTGAVGFTNRSILVGASSAGDTQSLAILLKHDPAVTFAPANDGSSGVACPPQCGDLQGYGGGGSSGSAGGGSKKVAYNHVTSGPAPQEWGFALGQIGRSLPPGIQFHGQNGIALPHLTASSTPALPTDKISAFALSTDGFIVEYINPGIRGPPTPVPPEVLISNGYMSDDKTVFVGVGTAIDGSNRFVLRVDQAMNTSADDLRVFTLADLAGTYGFAQLVVGASPRSASGTLSVDPAGAASFTSYLGSDGSTAAPGGLALALDASPIAGFYGVLSDAGDSTAHGKLDYYKDMFVVTRTEPSGASSLTIAVK